MSQPTREEPASLGASVPGVSGMTNSRFIVFLPSLASLVVSSLGFSEYLFGGVEGGLTHEPVSRLLVVKQPCHPGLFKDGEGTCHPKPAALSFPRTLPLIHQDPIGLQLLSQRDCGGLPSSELQRRVGLR